MTAWPDELTGRMEGLLVIVEPLAPEHEEGLLAAGHEGGHARLRPAQPDALSIRP